jgi:hypothetical protein
MRSAVVNRRRGIARVLFVIVAFGASAPLIAACQPQGYGDGWYDGDYRQDRYYNGGYYDNDRYDDNRRYYRDRNRNDDDDDDNRQHHRNDDGNRRNNDNGRNHSQNNDNHSQGNNNRSQGNNNRPNPPPAPRYGNQSNPGFESKVGNPRRYIPPPSN